MANLFLQRLSEVDTLTLSQRIEQTHDEEDTKLFFVVCLYKTLLKKNKFTEDEIAEMLEGFLDNTTIEFIKDGGAAPKAGKEPSNG